MMNGYLLFVLAGRLFGVKLAGAVEILAWHRSRGVPLSYSYVEGLLDYRGAIYPVFNLQQRLGLQQHGPIGFIAQNAELAAKGKSIILIEEKSASFGITVDNVLRMITIDDASIVPGLQQDIDPKYMTGVAAYEGQEIVILDFERLLHAG